MRFFPFNKQITQYRHDNKSYVMIKTVLGALQIPGPSCSKLTTLLVNVSLKFQTLILQIHCFFNKK